MHLRLRKKTTASILLALFLVRTILPPLAVAEEVTPSPSPSPSTDVAESTASNNSAPASENTDQPTEEASSAALTESSPAPSSSPEPATDSNQDTTTPTELDDTLAAAEDQVATLSAALAELPPVLGNLDLETGDATASAATLTLVNTTQQDSSVDMLVADVTTNEGDINLSKASNGESSDASDQDPQAVSSTEITAENEAEVVIDTTAAADTGTNEQAIGGGTAEMLTGTALAVANSVALINSILLNSSLQYYFINILTDFEGNLILPNLEYLLELLSNDCVSCATDLDLDVLNQAVVDNNVLSDAQTGSNQQAVESGETTLVTGDASSVAMADSEVNQVYMDLLLFALQINNLQEWEGFIYGWLDPESVYQAQGSFELSALLANNQQPSVGTAGTDQQLAIGGGAVDLNVANQANVQVNTTATANTGNNLQLLRFGDAYMQTGDALALANSTVLANQLYINSRVWDGTINIMGNWTGDIYFAYPDLEVTYLEAPSSYDQNQAVKYVVRVTNKGLADARDVTVRVQLPASLLYQSNSWGLVRQEGQNLFFDLNFLAPGDYRDITIFARALSTVNDGEAANSEAEVMGRYSEKMANNYALAIGRVAIARSNDDGSRAAEEDDDNDDATRSPEDNPSFSVSAANNVNHFIYPGDTGIFQIEASNLGGSSYNTFLYVALIDANGYQIGGGQVPLDKIATGEKVKISFNMMIPPTAPGGEYQLVAWIEGENYLGEVIISSDAITSFAVQSGRNFAYGESRGMEGYPASFASADQSELQGSVLGASEAVSRYASFKEMLYLGFLLITQLFVRKARILFEM